MLSWRKECFSWRSMLRRVGSPFIGLFLFRPVLYWQAQASSQEEPPALTRGSFPVAWYRLPFGTIRFRQQTRKWADAYNDD